MIAGASILGDYAIPGDVQVVESLTARLQSIASNVQTIESRVMRNGLSGSWSGHGADAFRSSLGEVPGEIEKLNASFSTAANVMQAFSTALGEYQNTASWLASKIEQEESAQRDAEQRHASAQNALSSAEHAYAGASDPVSQAKAQTAMDQAKGAAATARDDIQNHGDQISSWRRAAESNYSDYKGAISTCCNGLGVAGDLGIKNDPFGGIKHFVGDMAGDVVGVVLAPVHWAEKSFTDAEKFLAHPSWDAARALLEDVKAPLEVAGAALLVVGVVGSLVLTGGADAPILLAIASAGEGVGVMTLGVDSAVTAGDGSEAIFGSGETQRDARQHLTGDVASTATDAVGVRGAAQDSAELNTLSDKASNEAADYLDTGNSHYLGWVTRYQNQYMSKLTNVSGRLEGAGVQYLTSFDQANMEQFAPGTDTPKPTLLHRIAVPPPWAALGIG